MSLIDQLREAREAKASVVGPRGVALRLAYERRTVALLTLDLDAIIDELERLERVRPLAAFAVRVFAGSKEVRALSLADLAWAESAPPEVAS